MAILVVEDNPVNAKLIELVLKGEGFDLLVVKDGEDALARLSERTPIELIISDLSMPKMGGLEFMAKIKAMPQFAEIPFMIVSAQGDVQTVTQAKALGCVGFLTKPIDKKQLVQRVNRLAKPPLPVLQDRHEVLKKLNIGAGDYDALVAMLAGQLNEIMPMLLLEKNETDEPISDHLRRLLDGLTESAAILGAMKFLHVYKQCAECKPIPRAHCGTIFSVLQELEQALGGTRDPDHRAA